VVQNNLLTVLYNWLRFEREEISHPFVEFAVFDIFFFYSLVYVGIKHKDIRDYVW
jgi:hypothetical protein